MPNLNLNNLYFQKYARSQTPEMGNLDYQVLQDAYNLDMVIPDALQVLDSDAMDVATGKKLTLNLYYEYFELIYNAHNAGIAPVEFIKQNYEAFMQMTYSIKSTYIAELREIFVKGFETMDIANAILIEKRAENELADALAQLPDKERLQMLYYMSTGEELTEELQTYLEQDLQESGTPIDNLTSDQVAYLAQTATRRYADRGAIIVNDSEVQIPNTNNPNSVRANTPITRERLKEMMNNQTNAVDELRQKNTKAYSNIPGLNRPNMPVSKSQTLFKAEPISPSTTNLANSDYNDYE